MSAGLVAPGRRRSRVAGRQQAARRNPHERVVLRKDEGSTTVAAAPPSRLSPEELHAEAYALLDNLKHEGRPPTTVAVLWAAVWLHEQGVLEFKLPALRKPYATAAYGSMDAAPRLDNLRTYVLRAIEELADINARVLYLEQLRVRLVLEQPQPGESLFRITLHDLTQSTALPVAPSSVLSSAPSGRRPRTSRARSATVSGTRHETARTKVPRIRRRGGTHA